MPFFRNKEEEVSRAADTAKEGRVGELNAEFQDSHSQPKPAGAQDKRTIEKRQTRAAQALEKATSDLSDYQERAREEAEGLEADYNDLIAERERLVVDAKKILDKIAELEKEMELMRIEEMGGKEMEAIELTDKAA